MADSPSGGRRIIVEGGWTHSIEKKKGMLKFMRTTAARDNLTQVSVTVKPGHVEIACPDTGTSAPAYQ